MFCVQPFFGPLLFDNTDSDARDHCANERSMVTQLPHSVCPFLFTLLELMYREYARACLTGDSIPLISSSISIHVYCLCGYHHLFPSQNQTYQPGATYGTASRRSFLGPWSRMFSCWVWELYQDCDKILKKDGPSANGVENSSSKAYSSSVSSSIMRGYTRRPGFN